MEGEKKRKRQQSFYGTTHLYASVRIFDPTRTYSTLDWVFFDHLVSAWAIHGTTPCPTVPIRQCSGQMRNLNFSAFSSLAV